MASISALYGAVFGNVMLSWDYQGEQVYNMANLRVVIGPDGVIELVVTDFTNL